jgi:hypothetical protein
LCCSTSSASPRVRRAPAWSPSGLFDRQPHSAPRMKMHGCTWGRSIRTSACRVLMLSAVVSHGGSLFFAPLLIVGSFL